MTSGERDAGGTRSLIPVASEVVNDATIRGGLALLGGLLILGLPGISPDLLEIALSVALLGGGLLSVRAAVTGGRLRATESRLVAGGRGVIAVAVVAWSYLTDASMATVLVIGVGGYLVVSGLLALGRRRTRVPVSRIAAGLAAIALGYLSVAAPSGLTSGLVLTGALAGVLIGAIVFAYGLRASIPGSHVEHPDTSVREILWDWVRTADVGPARRDELAPTLYFEAPGKAGKLSAWWVMLLLSATIATFAVLQDSTAVVIGAMLVAPLMTPILGLAGALVNGWPHRAASSAWLAALGSLAVVGLSFTLSRWVPALASFDTNGQITSRVDPTLIDLLIAVAAGAAGAYATVNARVAASIAGVAIAVALVPPLSVAGIMLAAGRGGDAAGASLLFLTNFVGIVLAAALVFVLTGFADVRVLGSRPRELLLTLAPFAALALLILVPLVYTSQGIVVHANQERVAQDSVDDWLEDDLDLRVLSVTVDGAAVTVNLTGSAEIPPAAPLQATLAEGFGEPVDLSVELVRSDVVDVDASGRETRG